VVLGRSHASAASQYSQYSSNTAGSDAKSVSAAIERFLLQVVDGSLAGVIFVVPLLMGGRHAIGQLALTVFAVSAAWAWAVRQSLRRNAKWQPVVATPLLLIGLLLIVLQTVPLPPGLLARLSPGMAGLLPLWGADAKAMGLFANWPCLSFTPAETLAGLVSFVDYAMLFCVAVQRIRDVEDIERLLRWCAVSALVMACLGLAQLLFGNGKFFWFYEHPFSNPADSATGSFTNRNHFAQFMALGIGPMIWWLQDTMRRMRGRGEQSNVAIVLLGLALGLVLFAGLLSLSRGGISAMLLAAAICTVVCYRSSSLGRRLVATLAGAGVLIGVSLAIFGYDRVSDRVETLSSGSLEKVDGGGGRRTIWATSLKAVPSNMVLGTGVGSFSEVYSVYAETPDRLGREPSHAECCYLQVLVETGVIGLGLLMWGVVLCGWWCVGGIAASVPTRFRLCAAAITASLAASALHAMVDFIWYAPACMAIVVILAACALRVWQLRRNAEERSRQHGKPKPDYQFPDTSRLAGAFRPSLSWPVAVVMLTCAGVWMISDRLGPAVAQTYWDRFLVACRAAEAQDPTAPDCPLTDADTQQQWIAWLEKAVQWQPTHVPAHLKLVETHRRLFDILQQKSENPMSLIQIGDAVFNEPQFRSREARMEWLQRAVGPHWSHLSPCLEHARKALFLCPLEGRSYVHIAELSLLWAADRAAARTCIDQALRVRPFDGEVLYAAGNDALLAGDEPRWREYHKRAYRWGRPQQRRIVSDRLASTPTESLPLVIADVLREFQPDLEIARFLYAGCESRCPREQLAPLIGYCARAAENEAAAMSGSEAANTLVMAHQFHKQLGDNEAALRCVRTALQCDSGSYSAHYYLGRCLLSQSQFAEAETHLRWCLQRKPNDKGLEEIVREAFKGRLDDERRAAKENSQPITR
jgi:O-antigen ligase/tetratricopeptide (TPR) repeat protein